MDVMEKITYLARVISDNGIHVWFNFHVGWNPGSRGLSGKLCLRKEEFEDMVKKLKMEVRPCE